MHTFTFDPTRYKEVRNRGIINSALFILAAYAVVFRDFFLGLFTGNASGDGLVAFLAIALGLAFVFINNSDTREHYESITITVDENCITHYEKGKLKGKLLFSDIKEIIKYPSGLEINTTYAASSLTVLPQMHNYNQIIELLSNIKPVQPRNFNRIYVSILLIIIALGIVYVFVNKDLAGMVFCGIVALYLCYATFTLLASPLVDSDRKWVSGPIMIFMAISFGYLTYNHTMHLFYLN